jgi:hypothetical protein
MMFEKLNLKDKTFIELEDGHYTWWDNILKDKDLSVQIRKDNTIDVYYNGGALIAGLEYGKGGFSAQIHPKYIPFEKDGYYKKMSLTRKGIDFKKQDLAYMSFSNLEKDKLKAIKNRIGVRHENSSEKAIQYRFANLDQSIIDAEFQSENELRIDLVRIDQSVKKLVFIEVKTMGDKRLYTNEIIDQLTKYYDYVKANAKDLLEYYKKVLQIKKTLGIITTKELINLSLDDYSVEPKPLLVFGDCEQLWIDKYSDAIDKKIQKVAYGAYYYGQTGSSLDLSQKKEKNRHVF